MNQRKSYDWAAAIFALAQTDANDLNELVRAADLDPVAGDLSDVDFSGLDLSNQNLGGWDLRHARFLNARLTRTELRDAIVNPEGLIEAVNWEEARLDDGVRAKAEKAAAKRDKLMSRLISELDFSVRTTKSLQSLEIKYLGDLVQRTEAELLRAQNFGRKTLNEVKELLVQSGLHLGMELDNWPPGGRAPEERQ